MTYQPKTGTPCSCKPGIARDNCPQCEGTGQRIDFEKIRAASLYDDLRAAGCELDNHESDLYVKDTAEARAILARHQRSGKRFTSQIDGRLWLDVPFAFAPWWRERGAHA
jgi:hypothetical protein